MQGQVLVLNAGSSSLKFSVFAREQGTALAARYTGQVDGIGKSAKLSIADDKGSRIADQSVQANDHDGAIAAIHDWFAGSGGGGEASFAAVGHRIVHGGTRYTEPVLINDAVMRELAALVPLAPLHQPHNIAAIRAVAATAPKVPQVACFDTAFHRGQPPLAQQFALPRALSAKGIIRYGFHGLSYEYIVSALPRVVPSCARGKIVIAHLGNGASLCAVEQGRSIATTMSFTPVDGLVMGTRSGSLDPGVVLYLLRHEGMDADAVEKLINQQSGLLGVSGVSSDMRELLASSDPHAREAVDLFVYCIARELGSLAAALHGLDAVIFTGGIGEHAAPVRAAVCRATEWLGLTLDAAANEAGGPRLSTADSRVSAWMIPTDENLMIARHTIVTIERQTK